MITVARTRPSKKGSRKQRRRGAILVLPHELLEKILCALSPWTARRHMFHAGIFGRTCKQLHQVLSLSFLFWEQLFRRNFVIARSMQGSPIRRAVCMAVSINFRHCRSHRLGYKALLDQYCLWVGHHPLPSLTPRALQPRVYDENVPLDRGAFLALAKHMFHMDKTRSCGLCGARGRFAHTYKMWSLGVVLCRACRTEHFVSDRRLMEAYGVNVAGDLSAYEAFARVPRVEVECAHAAWALEFTREQPAPLLALFAGRAFYFQVPFCLCCLLSGSPHSRVCVRCSTFKFPLY